MKQSHAAPLKMTAIKSPIGIITSTLADNANDYIRLLRRGLPHLDTLEWEEMYRVGYRILDFTITEREAPRVQSRERGFQCPT